MTLLEEIQELAADHAARKARAFAENRPTRKRRRANASELTCARKDAYTYEMAKLVCYRIRDHQHRVVRLFKCHVCGFWHVGGVL